MIDLALTSGQIQSIDENDVSVIRTNGQGAVVSLQSGEQLDVAESAARLLYRVWSQRALADEDETGNSEPVEVMVRWKA